MTTETPAGKTLMPLSGSSLLANPAGVFLFEATQMTGRSYITLKELAKQLKMDRSHCRRFVKRIGVKTEKRRPAGGGPLLLTVSNEDAEFIRNRRLELGFLDPEAVVKEACQDHPVASPKVNGIDIERREAVNRAVMLASELGREIELLNELGCTVQLEAWLHQGSESMTLPGLNGELTLEIGAYDSLTNNKE